MKTLTAIVLTTGIACASPTRAKRDYDLYPQHRRSIAFYNMQQIMSEHCNEKNFAINQQGFHCDMYGAVGHFQWEEIKEARCQGGGLLIIGNYDDFLLYTHHNYHPQCQDLEEAFRIYLEERRK